MSITAECIDKFRKGEGDCNLEEGFFPAVIKAFMADIRGRIYIRQSPIPHQIVNTGDDTMWLLGRGYDHSVEPQRVSNESGIYMGIPRCVVAVEGINLVPDQLTNPYVPGVLQLDRGDVIVNARGEFRRMPIRLEVSLKYILDTFNDALGAYQSLIATLAFIRTYRFVYLGQTLSASYRLPDGFKDDHQIELTGSTGDDRSHRIDVQVEIETNMPVYDNKTLHEMTRIAQGIANTTIKS